MHSRFHGSLNPYVCPDYGDTFLRKFQLVNNGRIHGKVSHSYTLRRKEFLHKRTPVSDKRIYTGDQLLEEFISKAELKQHERNTHGGVNPNSSNTTINSNQQNHSQQKQQQAEWSHPQTITVCQSLMPKRINGDHIELI
ncbi:unnamed protein product [Ceratitis capitata]|uniref:(Mediterranean fruit fly) hypothetical protein n=1 Tax=Ceratitis capitata TaxID=7213 RepID=A0A811UUF8_CERCA|nr:unnamed protein product [Ceratitis capitata]CAD7001948.1 unnamed protein product [Ceratitis capitata]